MKTAGAKAYVQVRTRTQWQTQVVLEVAVLSFPFHTLREQRQPKIESASGKPTTVDYDML